VDSTPVDWALFVAEEKLAGPMPGRWRHVQGVIARARAVARSLRLPPAEHDLLVAGAAVHDIGLAPDVAATKASFLDGARWLAEQGAPARLVDLVAHCDCGQVEAALQGHEVEYARYSDERSPTRDALWYCCLTTGADGTPVSVDERIAAWATTYAGDAVITRYAVLARDELLAAVARTEDRLDAAQGP
jgi:hypothetical protein